MRIILSWNNSRLIPSKDKVEAESSPVVRRSQKITAEGGDCGPQGEIAPNKNGRRKPSLSFPNFQLSRAGVMAAIRPRTKTIQTVTELLDKDGQLTVSPNTLNWVGNVAYESAPKTTKSLEIKNGKNGETLTDEEERTKEEKKSGILEGQNNNEKGSAACTAQAGASTDEDKGRFSYHGMQILTIPTYSALQLDSIT